LSSAWPVLNAWDFEARLKVDHMSQQGKTALTYAAGSAAITAMLFSTGAVE